MLRVSDVNLDVYCIWSNWVATENLEPIMLIHLSQCFSHCDLDDFKLIFQQRRKMALRARCWYWLEFAGINHFLFGFFRAAIVSHAVVIIIIIITGRVSMSLYSRLSIYSWLLTDRSRRLRSPGIISQKSGAATPFGRKDSGREPANSRFSFLKGKGFKGIFQ